MQVWFQNRRSKERRMKQLSALGARRHFFRNPRRIRGLRPGEDLVDNPDMMGQPGFNYFGEFFSCLCSSPYRCLFGTPTLLLLLLLLHLYPTSMWGRYGTIVTSSSGSAFSLRSSFTQSAHLFFGLPLLLLPCTSIPIALFPTYSSPLLITYPYHRILRSWTFFEVSPTFVLPLILSYIILSNLVTPHIHRNFIYATSRYPYTAMCSFARGSEAASIVVRPWFSTMWFSVIMVQYRCNSLFLWFSVDSLPTIQSYELECLSAAGSKGSSMKNYNVRLLLSFVISVRKCHE